MVHACNSSYLVGMAGGYKSEASLGKSTRLYQKNKLKLKAKGLGTWLKG
jgi:hypothetical protein